MNKKQLIDYLEEKKEYLDTMQKDFGNDSWWYSNRKSDDCINCKIYSYVDVDSVYELLSEKEKQKIGLLGIDIEKLCNDFVWGGDYFDYSWIWQARLDTLEMLKEKYPEVVDITYHGRQGGWACIQYNFEIRSSEGWTLDDNLNDAPIRDLKELKKQVKKAIQTIIDVEFIFKEKYKKLCNELEEPKNYIDEVRHAIEKKEEFLIDDIDTKSELINKLKALK